MEQRIHRWIKLGLNADQADIGLQRARCRPHSRQQSATADRHHQHIERRDAFQHFQRDRTLPRRHIRVIERVNESQPQLGLQAPCMFIRVVEALTKQHDVAADALGLHDFDRGRWHRHNDSDGNAQSRAVIT